MIIIVSPPSVPHHVSVPHPVHIEDRIWVLPAKTRFDSEGAPGAIRWFENEGNDVSGQFSVSDVSDFRSPSWIGESLRRLSHIATLRRGWNGYTADPPNQTSVHLARSAIDALHSLNFRPSFVGPSAEGGVGITFSRGNKRAVLEIYNDGEAISLMAIDGHQPQASDVPPTEQGFTRTLAAIKAFIDNDSGAPEDQWTPAG
jgi:hypothetical protein